MSDSWTILKMLQWTADYLKGKGLESPRLEAEVLLAHLFNLKRIDLYVQFERILTPDELASFKALLKRRVDHEPLAYIVGKKEFYSREFLVTPDVLVPRPETELVVEQVLKSRVPSPESRVEEKNNKNEILTSDQQPATSDGRVRGLEVGLGSGCISITLLLENPHLSMDAIDISEKAIDVAKQNAVKHEVANRLEILCEDFLSPRFQPKADPPLADTFTRRSFSEGGLHASRSTLLHQGSGGQAQYDFIVSNPPYVRSAEMAGLPETVKKYEPAQALDGGKDGLDFYRALVSFAQNHLKPQGFMAVEIGEDQGKDVRELFEGAGFVGTEILKDFLGKERVLWTKSSSQVANL